MARTGRPRKSVETKVLAGTFRQHREPAGVAPGEAVSLEMPSHLSAAARAEWDLVVAELNGMGVLRPTDRVPLATYCDAYARWVSASNILQRRGNTFKTKSGFMRPRPEVSLRDDALEQMRGFLNEMSARAAKLAPKAVTPQTRRERLLDGGA